MSSVSLQDLIKKGYNIVSINAKDVAVSEQLPTTDSKSWSQDCKEVAVLDAHGNIVEPLDSRHKRTFLLISEITGNNSVSPIRERHFKSSGVKSGMKGKKGKRAGKASGGGGVQRTEMGTAWGFGMTEPFLNNYIRSNKPYTFTQRGLITAILTSSNSIPTFYSTYFTANSIDQFSSFAAVFDQYRFDLIEVWISSQEAHNTSVNSAKYASVIDYDDSAALTLYQQALDYTNCVETPSQDGHYHKFIPHVAVASYSGTFVSYNNVTSPWIDCTSTTVQHYGIKVAHQTSSSSNILDLQYRYNVSFRNVR